MDTLAFGYILPTTGQIWDFNPLETCAARRTKEIAEALCFGEGTVRNYLSTILNKLNLRDRTQLAIWYLNADREATAFMSK